MYRIYVSSTSVATFDLLLPAHHETTTPSSTPTPQPPKKLKAKKQEPHATAASEAEFDRLRRRAPQHCGADGIWSQAQFYGCGTWDVEGLAEAHDELDGLEEGKEEERLLAQLGMDEYYGSEGFDRPPSDVYDGAGA